MGREIRRVPLEYEYVEGETWPGFNVNCDGCELKPADDEDCEAECPRHYDPPTGEGYQIWETVSEGSPVSKVFATEDELIEFLHKEGATGIFKPCTRAAARHFVRTKWVCSMTVVGGFVADGVNAYSAGIHPFLNGFDTLSDEIIDELRGADNHKKIEELLLQFRERTDKFTQIFEAAGSIHRAAKGFHGKLPEEISKAVADFDSLVKKLYPEVKV